MKLKSLFLYGVLSLAVVMPLTSQAIEMRGNGTFKYEGGLFSSGPTDAERNAALNRAKVSAINKYAASLGPAQQRLLNELKGQIESNPDEFLHGFHIISENNNSGTKTYTVLIRADVNEAYFNEQLRKNSAANFIPSGTGSSFSGLFVARRIVSSREYDERTTKISEDRRTAGGGFSGNEEYATSGSKSTTGGSRLRQAAKTTYGQIAATDFDAAFNEVLTSRGFEFTDYSFVAEECGGPKVSVLQAQFKNSDELPQKLINQAIKAAKKCGVQFFAIGNMNVSAPSTDPVSGNRQVGVSVSGKVWNIKGRLPMSVASVRPVQYYGLGPDDESARREALRLAAENAAETITAQLGMKILK